MATDNFSNRIRTKLRAVFIFCLTGLPVYLLASAFAAPPDSVGAVTTDSTVVKVTSERMNGITHFFVQNLERSEVTMTFDFNLQNLKSNVQFPYTATFKPGQSEAFNLEPLNSDEQWQYSFTNYYKLGSSIAEPDAYVYALPYAPGRTYRVTQGYDGKFSHQGSNKYAIDWKMPEGTPVLAARDGLVVKVKDDSNRGGSSMKFDPYNNYVLIRHADGTLGHYCHLQKGGVKVAPGDYVKVGEPIALSGNTGFSSGAHLHFCVFMTRDGRERVSIPVKFRAASGEPITLVEGQSYPAGEVRNAKTLATMARHTGGSLQ
jgi:murein DD-endopeptidase MepM/ murein hydrolase activator NlpD